MAAPRQFVAQLAVIVNLTIKDDDQITIGVGHRLMPPDEIKNFQASCTKRNYW